MKVAAIDEDETNIWSSLTPRKTFSNTSSDMYLYLPITLNKYSCI
jgi:hypothetical protein